MPANTTRPHSPHQIQMGAWHITHKLATELVPTQPNYPVIIQSDYLDLIRTGSTHIRPKTEVMKKKKTNVGTAHIKMEASASAYSGKAGV